MHDHPLKIIWPQRPRGQWGHESLVLTTSIAASLNFIFLYDAMMRYAGDIGTKSLVAAFFKIGFSTAVMEQECLTL